MTLNELMDTATIRIMSRLTHAVFITALDGTGGTLKLERGDSNNPYLRVSLGDTMLYHLRLYLDADGHICYEVTYLKGNLPDRHYTRQKGRYSFRKFHMAAIAAAKDFARHFCPF